ncbi:MAG: hypothetical protein U0175_16420 [Caldilineaceae bacterium]
MNQPTHADVRARIPMLLLAILGLLAAMWAGLLRLGWDWPVLQPTLPMAHGPLMVGGFLGTVIGLERAVGLGKRWAYAAPILTALGAVTLAIGASNQFGALLMTLGSAWLLLALIQITRIHVALHSLLIAAGGVAFLIGNLLWLSGWLIPYVVLWWAGYVILTVVGERLELSRVVRLGREAYLSFGLGVTIFALGLGATVVSFDWAMRLTGVGMLSLGLWLLYFDVARRRLKAGGQARFIAVTLLSGYLWLAIGGILAISYGGFMAGPFYDAILHAIFLGFTISMIFAHAPIIFPALLRIEMRFSLRFYLHTLLLSITLTLRIVSDLLLWQPGRQWGGLLNVVTLLFFLFNTFLSLRPLKKS